MCSHDEDHLVRHSGVIELRKSTRPAKPPPWSRCQLEPKIVVAVVGRVNAGDVGGEQLDCGSVAPTSSRFSLTHGRCRSPSFPARCRSRSPTRQLGLLCSRCMVAFGANEPVGGSSAARIVCGHLARPIRYTRFDKGVLPQGCRRPTLPFPVRLLSCPIKEGSLSPTTLTP